MIKIINNLFNDPERIEESNIEIQVENTREFETPEKTKQELFDEAVLEVLKSKHCKIIRQQLIEMCYSDEEVEQTKQAQDYFSKEEDPDREALRMKYPHSVWVSSGGYSGRSD